ncbi:hypothetical protein [Burkholderia ubonensis]|uniref:hypothetical protein n=1 Tax=Burkholderia ubonensis TaxID=101571 RepID=UPI0012F80573|nr:hypothetical protein [Burkholderia ubonensis]
MVSLLNSPGMIFTNSPSQIDQHSLQQKSTHFDLGINVNGDGAAYVLYPEQFVFSLEGSHREVIVSIMAELSAKNVDVFGFGDPQNDDDGNFEALVKILETRLPAAPKDTLGDVVCDALLQANTFLEGSVAIEVRTCMRQNFPNYWSV